MKAVRTIAVGIAILAVSCLVLLPGEAQAGRRGGGCCCGWSGSYGWDNCGYSDCRLGRLFRPAHEDVADTAAATVAGIGAAVMPIRAARLFYQTASHGGCGTGCCPSTAGPGATTSGHPNVAAGLMAPGSQNARLASPAPKTPPSKRLLPEACSSLS